MAAAQSCNLEQQVDEFELLQSVYSALGEFQIEDQLSYDKATAYLKQLIPDPPAALSCKINILVDAHLHSDDEDETTTSSPAAQYSVTITVRLPNR